MSVWPSLWGGYSRYVYLHPDAVLHKLPDHVSASEASLFLPISNGIEWVCNYGRVTPGQIVVVQGPGQQGLACVLAARVAGAGCIIGTPDDCLEQIQRYEQAGFNFILMRCQWAGIDAAKTLRSIRLLGEEVLPHLNRT